MSNTVEVLADAFLECGTPFIAGHPGGESVDLMDAARARDMRYILIRPVRPGPLAPRATAFLQPTPWPPPYPLPGAGRQPARCSSRGRWTSMRNG